MNSASSIKKYFATLPIKNTENSHLKTVVDRVSKEKPGYLRFLLGYFQQQKIVIALDIRNLVVQKIENHLSLFERLPLEVKSHVFSFLAPKDLNRASQAFLDLRSILDSQRIIWTNQNKGDVIALDLPDAELEALLTNHGQQLHVLQFNGCYTHFLMKKGFPCRNISTLITNNHHKTSLTEFLPTLDQLTTLKQLRITGMLDEQINALAVQVGKLTNLQQLIVKDTSIHACKVDKLPSELSKLTNLQTLHLSQFTLDTTAAKKLADPLKKLTTLVQLKLKSNRINKEIILLGIPIGKLTHLQTLNLRGNLIETKAMNRFAEQLGKLTHLTELDLSYNKFNAGTKKTARQLGKLVHLRRLYLQQTKTTARGMRNLTRQFAKLIFLEDLDLSYNNLFTTYPKGFHQLGKLTNLRKLNLAHTNIEDIEPENMKRFARPFSKLTTLQNLNFSDSGINNKGIIKLSNSLGELINLVNLNLSFNDFSNRGVKNLALIIGKLTRLQIVDLSDCDFTTSGTTQLIQALNALPCLTRADLRANSIDRKIAGISQSKNINGLLKIIEFDA